MEVAAGWELDLLQGWGVDMALGQSHFSVAGWPEHHCLHDSQAGVVACSCFLGLEFHCQAQQ